MGALSALGARGYKTTTGIVGVEVDPEAPETLRHLLCDFASPERLTPDEFDELDLGQSVDYRDYVRSLTT